MSQWIDGRPLVPDPDRERHFPLPATDDECGMTYADPTIRHPGDLLDHEDDRRDWLAAQASWVPRLINWLVSPTSPSGVAARVYVLALALGIPTGLDSDSAIATACRVTRETVSEYARRLADELGLTVPGRRSRATANRCRAARQRRLAP
jgi:hypothetical protein